MKVEVTDIQRLSVKPGEVLLVKVPPSNGGMRGDQSAVMKETVRVFREVVPKGVKVVVMQDNFEVQVVPGGESVAESEFGIKTVRR